MRRRRAASTWTPRAAARREPAANSTMDTRIVALLEGRPRSAWRTSALNQARQLYDDLRAARPRAVEDRLAVEIGLAKENIERGASAAHVARRRLRTWLTGADIDTAWAALHAAEERLVLIEPVAALRRRLGGIDTSLRSNLRPDDPRLKRYTDQLAILQDASDVTLNRARQQIRGYLHDTYAAIQAAHDNVRATRNTLMQISLGTLALIAAICVVHAVRPGFIDLRSASGAVAEPWWIVMLGSLGGVIGALATVWRLGGSTSDSRLPNAQAFVRIPMGGAIALAGVMLLQSGFISPLKSQTPLALLAFAFLAGYTPDLLLRYLDGSLKPVLSEARGKDNPARTTLSEP